MPGIIHTAGAAAEAAPAAAPAASAAVAASVSEQIYFLNLYTTFCSGDSLFHILIDDNKCPTAICF